jgi:DNA modification methylase
MVQTRLDQGTPVYDVNGGTFVDNLQLPVHRWFRYPAGFSGKFISEILERERITSSKVILDPFAGSATTLVTAKSKGIPSEGVESHPLLHLVGKTKLYWSWDIDSLRDKIFYFLNELENTKIGNKHLDVENYPELIRKCFDRETLRKLIHIKNLVEKEKRDTHFYDFLRLGLLSILRKVSYVNTANWTYILPRKRKEDIKEPYNAFKKQLTIMLNDLMSVHDKADVPANLVNGDARSINHIHDGDIDLAITSPPYLNNFDYADSTRLELYFLGWAKTWDDITKSVRNKLIISATTQILRNDEERYELPNDMNRKIREQILEKVEKLRKLRLEHGGKKSYDFMVMGYFSDMYFNLKEIFRVLDKPSKYIMVLGDSAPYGVYVPTDTLLGDIAVSIGFSKYSIIKLRDRNIKWDNRKHKVPLKEVVLEIVKD